MLWFLIGIMVIKYIVRGTLKFVKTLNNKSTKNKKAQLKLIGWAFSLAYRF